jgi:hypothetical protein
MVIKLMAFERWSERDERLRSMIGKVRYKKPKVVILELILNYRIVHLLSMFVKAKMRDYCIERDV